MVLKQADHNTDELGKRVHCVCMELWELLGCSYIIEEKTGNVIKGNCSAFCKVSTTSILDWNAPFHCAFIRLSSNYFLRKIWKFASESKRNSQ